MKGIITIEVPDEAVAKRVDENWQQFAGPDDEKPAPHDYFRERLEDIASDEIRIAMFGWPMQVDVEVHGWFPAERERIYDLFLLTPAERELADRLSDEWLKSRAEAAESREHFLDWLRESAATATTHIEAVPVVLGCCPHGVDLDREMCEHGCRV